jgi:IclR family KDG regulon transcriptional repressor
MVSGVRHAGEILDLFTPHAPEWGAAGAACEVGISRTHAHRLLWSLADLGLLERQPNRRYRLGMRSLTLASVLLDTSPLVTNALPLLRSLNDRLDLDAALAVWERRGVLWLQPGADPLVMHRAPGDCVAGMVLLAGRPDAPSAAAFEIAQEPAVAPGVRSPDAPSGRREHVQAGGMIGDFRAGKGGACSMAAPIMDAAGVVVAALSVQASRARWQVHEREFTRALRSAAHRLSSVLAR